MEWLNRMNDTLEYIEESNLSDKISYHFLIRRLRTPSNYPAFRFGRKQLLHILYHNFMNIFYAEFALVR